MSPVEPPATDGRSSRTLEVVVVVACLVATAVMALPQLLPVLHILQSRGPADDASSFVVGARRKAVRSGTCVSVQASTVVNGTSAFVIKTVSTKTVASCPDAPDHEDIVFLAPAEVARFEGPRVVFLPNGKALQAARIEIVDERITPRRREIRITEEGRVCVRQASTTPTIECLALREQRQQSCAEASPLSVWSLPLAWIVVVLPRRSRRKRADRRRRRQAATARGYLLLEVCVAALVLATVVGLAFGYTGRVRAAQDRQELLRLAIEAAHVEADRISAKANLRNLVAEEDALATDRRLVRSVKYKRIRPDGAPSPDGALIEVVVRVKYPSSQGPQSVVARRIVRAP